MLLRLRQILSISHTPTYLSHNSYSTFCKYLLAGTQIVTTASYQASVEGFMKHLGVTEKEAIELIKDSVYLAKEALKRVERKRGEKLEVAVAGSIGPYGAYLHDGSDYTGSYKDSVTKESLKNWHMPRFKALVEAGADILGFETIPAMIEAEALIEILKTYPEMRAWLSFSARDHQAISSGELFYDVATKCWDDANGQLLAVGVNCLSPALVIPLFKKLREDRPDIKLIAYPNSGESYDTSKKRWVDKNTSLCLTDYTSQWLDLGVDYIGGCCRTNADDVLKFHEEVEKWKKDKRRQ